MWCITCAKLDNPDWEKNGFLSHKHIGLLQYFRCKFKGHEAYV